MIGKIARRAAFSGLAVATLIVNIQAKTGVAQGAAEACVAPAMFCHAMGQQHKLIAETALNLALAAIEEQNYVPGIHAIARNFKQRIHQA